MTIQISAVICTFNRDSYLRKAIQSLVDQTLDADAYEILIVDNRSTDNTKKVVTEEFSHLSNLRYLYEPIQGLSQARNTGWQNASGEYIAYLDDDAIAFPQWLEKIVEVFETVRPQPGGVGGKVEGIWEIPRPSWLSDQLLAHLTVVDWSDRPITLNEQQFLAGANMAFSKHILEKIQGFRVELGRKGNRLLSNEDLLLRNQLDEMGYSCFYHPEISVQHHIPKSRLNQRYFINRLYWQGVSNAILLTSQDSLSGSKRLQLAKNSIAKLWRDRRHLPLLTASTNEPDVLWNKCLKYFEIGYMLGILGLVK